MNLIFALLLKIAMWYGSTHTTSDISTLDPGGDPDGHIVYVK